MLIHNCKRSKLRLGLNSVSWISRMKLPPKRNTSVTQEVAPCLCVKVWNSYPAFNRPIQGIISKKVNFVYFIISLDHQGPSSDQIYDIVHRYMESNWHLESKSDTGWFAIVLSGGTHTMYNFKLWRKQWCDGGHWLIELFVLSVLVSWAIIMTIFPLEGVSW